LRVKVRNREQREVFDTEEEANRRKNSMTEREGKRKEGLKGNDRYYVICKC
jgi:hypothetical protein